MTKKAKPVKYTGALSTKIELLPFRWPSLLENPSELKESVEETLLRKLKSPIDVPDAREEKLPALFAHYGISPDQSDRWRSLALALAINHVPGFQVGKGRGAARLRPKLDIEHWADVRLIQMERKHSVLEACNILWKRTGKKGTAATVRRRFVEADKTYGPLLNGLPDELLKFILHQYKSELENASGLKA